MVIEQHDTGDLDVCISIVGGNDPRVTLECLASLLKSLSGKLKVEIHFVDNASPADWFADVGKLSHLIYSHRNVARKGFAANHNSIISQVKARYYLLLNDDTRVYPGCVEKLVAIAESEPSVGFLGPRLLNPDGSIQTSVYRFPSPNAALIDLLFLYHLHRLVPALDDYRFFSYQKTKTVDFISGAALLVKQEVCASVGLLDEQFFMYAEETDWSIRAKQAGWLTMFVADAQVMHYGGHSTVDYRPARSAEFFRSHEKLIRKHFGKNGLFAYKLINLIKHLPRMVIGVVVRWPHQRQMSANDAVLWSLGLLNRPGLAELAANHNYH